MPDPATYFKDWTTDQLRWRLRREESQGIHTFSACYFACGRGARGGGPCAACIKAELDRRERKGAK